MTSQNTQNHFKFNKKRRIGKVLIICEGESTERKYFKAIFESLLNYSVDIITRDRYYIRCKAISPDKSSKVIIANTKSSAIKTILDNEHRNTINTAIQKELGESLKNYRIYYVWDRDEKSNPTRQIKQAIATLRNPEMNDAIFEPGLLLLSYPCFESFIISNKDDVGFISEHPKDYIKNRGRRKYYPSSTNATTLIRATNIMIKRMEELGIIFNLNNLYEYTKVINPKEEKIYKSKKQYLLLSQVALMLIDLGIIEMVE